MPSNLTIHNNTITDASALRDWILTARPPLVKTLHHDAGFWAEIKAEYPELYILGRDYSEPQPLGSHPEKDAEAKGRHILDNSTARLFDGWEGYNEKDTYSGLNLPRQCVFDRRLGQIMRAEGLDYWAGSYGVGHPGVWLPAENRWLWEKPEFLDMLREPGVTGVTVHEYYAPRMDDPRNYDPLMPGTGWWLFRYRKWWPFLPVDCQKPLIISEYGIDSGAPHFDPGAQGGWRSFTLAGEYMGQLAGVDRELQRDEYVRAACIYCAWVADPTWETFDIAGDMADLLKYHIIAQRDPEPAPEPPPDVEEHQRCYDALTAAHGFLGEIRTWTGDYQEELQTMIDTLALPPIPFWAYIVETADLWGIEPAIIAGMVKAESGFNPDAVGSSGERGLMQISRNAWEEITRDDYDRAFEPELNVLVGSRYFHKYWGLLGENYQYDDVEWALVSYNWGYGNTRRHITGGGTLETLPDGVKTNLQNYLVGIAWAKEQ